jgi:Na+/alanine symporter
MSLAPQFVKFKGQVTSYFIGYCICFFAYAALVFYVSYSEKRQA